MTKINKDLIFGVGLIFAAPLLHVLHYFTPATPIPHQYYHYLKDFLWMMVPHTELLMTAIGLVIVASFRKKWIILIGLSPILHSIIDLSLNAFPKEDNDLWIIHPISYGSFIIIQMVLIYLWVKNNDWNE